MVRCHVYQKDVVQFLIDAMEKYQDLHLISGPCDICYTDIPFEFVATTFELNKDEN